MKLVNVDFKATVADIRKEFDNHLDAINANTDEIQSNFEYLQRLDRRIQKLEERLDEISLFLKNQDRKDGQKVEASDEKEYKIQPLTKKEKEVFFVLYTLSQSRKYITYRDIARRIAYPESLVQSYITNLIEKGIPITKRYVSRTVCLNLDPKFREHQSKTNIVGINSKLTSWIR